MSQNNMREKYESLSAAVLKDLCKARGIKGISRLDKAGLVEAMLKQDVADAAAKAEEAAGAETTEKKRGAAKKSAKAGKTSSKKEENKSAGELKDSSEDKAEENSADTSDKLEKKPKRGRKKKTAESESEEKKTVEKSHKKSSVEKTEDKKSDEKKAEKTEANTAGDNKADEKKSDNVKSETDKQKQKTENDFSQYNDLSDSEGILEVLTEGYGFLRSDNYMPGENDVYVSPSQIRRFNLKTGDVIKGKSRKNNQNDRYGALLFIENINGFTPEEAYKRKSFEDLTPIFPDERIKLEMPHSSVAMRLVDLFSPIGKGQRGMIVSQPKAGKTTLLKQVAKSVKYSHPDMHIIVLLIDERPEEVTDMKESIEGDNVEVIYSTFDELPEHHKRVSEMVIERAKRLVEHGKDVMILLDSITRLSRAYNLTVPPSGRTLSGGLDPAALHMPKRFFGAARNMREGGSLTILATALVDTGSKMDDVVYEEFKGTGNMELILDRKLSEKRVFPALDLSKSGTRRDDLLLTEDEQEAMNIVHRGLNGMRKDEATENILNMMTHTRTNADFINLVVRRRML